MKQQEFDRKRTDEAWKKLYKRLEEDALLHTKPARPTYWRAAVLLVMVALTALTLYVSTGKEQPLPALTSRQTEPAPIQTTVLEDNSIVYLDKEASLQYPESFAKDVREVTLEGSAMFDVTGNPEHPFRIKIGTVQVEVLGTTFYIRSNGTHFSEAGVKSGRIKVTAPEIGYPVYIGKGEKVVLQDNRLHVSNGIDESTTDHYTRRLHFKDAALGRVLHVLNRLNQEGFHFEATPETENRRLTFTYSTNPAETLAELISTALGIRYRKEGSTLIFTE